MRFVSLYSSDISGASLSEGLVQQQGGPVNLDGDPVAASKVLSTVLRLPDRDLQPWGAAPWLVSPPATEVLTYSEKYE